MADGVTYRHQLYKGNTTNLKNIWKITSGNADGIATNEIPNIY